eukprot:CAMPEP_0201720370 /NCGR_PEP_ID=MMETSP0593-20130828/5350_1 /ASSEMBLY_ACC=CAM_ASM_000672 /TAXON_ID=267983 /ORGANISM="Skeletonema japonicum, Strain CCMP2506" /LENGTH=243 /DNA_ID=CAMNT_0048211009 /DNA_START=23 /DNA_END=754 /DNA_ORIENTATION=+
MNIKYLLASFTTTTLATATSSSSSAQPLQNHPPCNICGGGTQQQQQDSSFEIIITNPDAVLHIPNMEGEDKTCAEWEIDGQNGRIPQEVCDGLPAVTVYVCDCQEVLKSLEPSPLPSSPSSSSSCSFCSDGITIQYDTSIDDEENDGFDETLCQRLVEGAVLISADSLYCEKLQVGEQLCCPSSNNNNGGNGGSSSMDMSFGDYSFLYHVGNNISAKASKKTKTRRGKGSKSGDYSSKAGKKL